jgi:hypothetical protein
MPRYQLANKCLFLDAKELGSNNRVPKELPFPHILDQRTTPTTYLKLSDGASFIARFIVQGVDTKLIPEIVSSEYGSQVKDPATDVQDVLNMLMPYLDKRGPQGPYEAPQPPDKNHPEDPYKALKGEHVDSKGKPLVGYMLDFSVNWFGTPGGYKLPH